MKIAGIAQCAAQGERVATAEAAVPAAGAEPLERQWPYPLQLPITGLPSWIQLTAHRLLVGDADQQEALRESGQVGLVCFHSQNFVLCDSKRFARE